MPSTDFCFGNWFRRGKQKNQDAPLAFIKENPQIFATYLKILIFKILISEKHSTNTITCLFKQIIAIVNDSLKTNEEKITELCNLISHKNSPYLSKSIRRDLSSLIQKLIELEIREIPEEDHDNTIMSGPRSESEKSVEHLPFLSDGSHSSSLF